MQKTNNLIKMKNKNKKWKTVFQTHYKLYKYIIMLFGFINILAIC